MKRKSFRVLIFLLILAGQALGAVTVRNIEYSIRPSGVTIYLRLRGTESFDAVVTKDKNRILVDLPGVMTDGSSLSVPDSGLVESFRLIRVSESPALSRLVISLSDDSAERVSSGSGYVRIDLNRISTDTPPITPREGEISAAPRPEINLPDRQIEQTSLVDEIASPILNEVISILTTGPDEQSEGGFGEIREMSDEKPDSGINLASIPPITLDVQDVELKDILRALAKQAGIDAILDDSVQGKVSVTLRDVEPQEAIHKILESSGYSIEERDGYIRPYRDSEMEVIHLNHADAAALKEIISPMAESPQNIQVDPESNSIFLSGSPKQVEKIKQIITEFDSNLDNRELSVFSLKNASAQKVAEIASAFVTKSGKVIADQDTNSVVVLDQPDTVGTVAQLIRRIDEMTPVTTKEIESPTLTTRVFTLRYVDANSLLTSVQGLLSPEGKAQVFVPQKSMITPLEQVSKGQGVKYVRVDETENNKREESRAKWADTLIVTDTPTTVETIAKIIEQIDVKPQQVLIEAKIVEIAMDDSTELGLDWQLTSPDAKTTAKFAPQKIDFTSGLKLGTIDTSVLDQIMGTIQALETQGKAKVLATPRTTALNNELAQIIVSDRIPVKTVYAGETYVTTSYEYLDVGMNLTVIPHISQDGYIILEVSPRIDSIKGVYNDIDKAEVPPMISSRVAHTRVAVENNQTLVIGGLMKEETSESISRVPLLGRIPLIGRLFSAKEAVKKKTDLMVFITPKIM